MKNFSDRLIELIEERQSPVCVGLSPSWDKIPSALKEKFKSSGAVLFIFNKGIIDAVADIVPAIVLDFSSYMRYGIGGMVSLKSTVDYARNKGLIVLTDLRGTGENETIAEAFLKAPTEDLPEQLRDGAFDTDAVTVNFYAECGIKDPAEMFEGFMGEETADRGLFAVYKEGALGSSELLKNIKNAPDTKGEYGFGRICIYADVNERRTLTALRKEFPDKIIAGEGRGFAREYFRENGRGGLVIVKESIMYAYRSSLWADKYGEKGFADAAREEAYRLTDKINGMI